MEHEQELRDFMMNSVRELGLTIGELQAEHFICYLTHLIEWNKAINLTAITAPKEIIIKHFVDSLGGLVATNFPQTCTVLDVGSGGGFPGIPLKIMRSDIRLVLVEPVQKKCSFLNSVIGLLRLHDASTFDGTIEQYAKSKIRYAIDIIVIRALKYDHIRKHITVFMAPKGKVVLYRTESIKQQDIGNECHLLNETDLLLPQGFGNRIITVLEKTG